MTYNDQFRAVQRQSLTSSSSSSYHYYFASGRGAEYCNECASLSVCLSVCLFVCPIAILHGFEHVAHGRCSVLLWRRCDTLRTSG